jgi:predicted dehydrogenase
MKAAVVGCGGIGLAHARAYREIPGVELAAVVDRDPERAAAVAAQVEAAALTDLAALPADVAVVSVATDPASHAPVALALLRRGHAVFCEKPLAMNAADAQMLASAAAGFGLPLGLGFKMRYEPVFQQARELLPRVGRLLQISSTKTQPFSARGEHDWRPAVGAMNELSVHDFDLVSFLAGLEPVRVVAAQLSFRLGWEREDGFSALVEYEQGVQASLSGCYATGGKWQGRDFSLTFTGELGYLRVLRGDCLILHTDGYETVPVPAPGNTFVSELTDFCAAVAAGTPLPLSATDGLRATRLIEAIWLSGREKRAVALAEL